MRLRAIFLLSLGLAAVGCGGDGGADAACGVPLEACCPSPPFCRPGYRCSNTSMCVELATPPDARLPDAPPAPDGTPMDLHLD